MTHWQSPDGTIRLLIGDVRERLRDLPDGSVHCVVTSPPYWGLRDYGTGTWEGGEEGCDHKPPQDWIDHNFNAKSAFGDGAKTQSAAAIMRWYKKDGSCPRCGARRIDKQLGNEKTPEEYVAKMVEVFRDVRRVLRDDGTCWLNLGDSYGTGASGQNFDPASGATNRGGQGPSGTFGHRKTPPVRGMHKQLIGIPWRVAFALQADGWYLRSEIIWAKPNPMPESVTDRPTKSHEQVFLLTKRPRYFYDAEAIREPHADSNVVNGKYQGKGGVNRGDYTPDNQGFAGGSGLKMKHREYNVNGRNRRSVWNIATKPYSEAHFATFPPDLIIPCIQAGTSERGCCATCGAPWERVVERGGMRAIHGGGGERHQEYARQQGLSPTSSLLTGTVQVKQTTGWQPTCHCPATEPVPCIVFDPFGGSGTTGQVARQLNRHAILVELNPKYADMLKKRVMQRLDGEDDLLPLFDRAIEPTQRELI